MQTVRFTVDKEYIVKLKSFCNANDTGNRTEQKLTEWEKILTYPISDRGLVSKIYKNSGN